MISQTGYNGSRSEAASAASFSELQMMAAARRERALFIGRAIGHLARSLWKGVSGLFGRMRHRRRVYAELMSLDDRMLSDIGLTRGDIPFVAKGVYQRSARNDNRSRAA